MRQEIALVARRRKARIAIPADRDGVVLRHRAVERPRWVGPAHHHDELELNYITAGRAAVIINRRRHELTPGTLLWLLADQSHLLVEMSESFEMWVGVFRPTLAARMFGEGDCPLTRREHEATLSRRIRRDDGQRLAHHLAMLHGHDLPTAPHNAGLGWLLIDAWRAYEAANVRDEPTVDDVHPCVEQAARRLQNDPAKWDLPALAAAGRVSPAWLSRLFTRQLGMTLTDYRNRQRLNRLAELCRSHPKLQLAHLAARAGFNSYSQCYRVCRAMLGKSPATWREQIL